MQMFAFDAKRTLQREFHGWFDMNIARHQSRFSRHFQLMVIIAMLPMLSACSRMSTTWTEEVRLPSGKLLNVDRTAKGGMLRDHGMRATGWKPEELTLRIPQRGLDIQAPPPWRSDLIPVVLDYDPVSSEWSVVATYLFCSTWYDMGRPESSYVQFTSSHGAPWQVVPLRQRLIGRPANLLTHIHHTGEPNLVREADKQAASKQVDEQFQAISPSWKTNC